MSGINHNTPTEQRPPPIGLAGIACFVCLAVVYLAARPFIGFLDRWGIQWAFYISLPIATAFTILYRSSWHQELPSVTRILSMILSSCIIFVVALLLGALAVVVVSVFFSGGMVSG